MLLMKEAGYVKFYGKGMYVNAAMKLSLLQQCFFLIQSILPITREDWDVMMSNIPLSITATTYLYKINQTNWAIVATLKVFHFRDYT